MSLFLHALFFVACSVFSANGHQFLVGGKRGWTLKPHESYSHWAGRNRFQVNDTLYFKYDKNTDSVLIVDKDDYGNCNTTTPQHKLEGGESVFKFDRSGPFFFITSNITNCQKGQKLIIVLLAIRPPPPPHVQPPPSPPSPLSPVPAPSPSQGSPPGKSGGAAVLGARTVLFSAVCVVLGLISG